MTGFTNGLSHRTGIKVALVALWVVSAAMLTGCDYFSSDERIGVSTGGDGSVQVHFLGCDYEQVLTVALYDGKDPNVDEDDVLLWEIRSDNGGPGGVFTVGSQPNGYAEMVGFDGAFADNMFVAVEIEDSIGAVIEFALPDLEPNLIYANGNPNSNMDAEVFAARARESCER